MPWLAVPGFWPMVLSFIVGVGTGAFGVMCLWLRWEDKKWRGRDE